MLDKLADILRLTGKRIAGLRDDAARNGVWMGAQLKTAADMEAHRTLSSALAQLEGGWPVISEEDTRFHTAERPDRYWLIDPIDGTASFADGFSGYVTQVALMQGGQPIAAAIFAPALGHMFLAEKGRGATLDGAPLNLRRQNGRLTLIDNYPEARGIAARLFDELKCTGYVESGSIALKVCRVADGTADLFVKDVAIRDWDVAAPALVLAEAGGFLTGIDGEPWTFGGAWEKNGLIAASDEQVWSSACKAIRQLGRASVQ